MKRWRLLSSSTMSGEIFQPLESLDEVDGAGLDPLCCHLCNERYEEPRVLQCYHTFCSRCLRGRAQDGVMLCPFCGWVWFMSISYDVMWIMNIIKFNFAWSHHKWPNFQTWNVIVILRQFVDLLPSRESVCQSFIPNPQGWKKCTFPGNMVTNKFSDFFTRKTHQNIHLNDKFPLKIAKISLQKQNFPGMKLPNSKLFPCMQTCMVTDRCS